MKRLFLLIQAAGFERDRYIPQTQGKVKRLDRRVERFAGWAVVSLKRRIARCEKRRRTRIANSGQAFDEQAVGRKLRTACSFLCVREASTRTAYG
jgi:hypothetical protein